MTTPLDKYNQLCDETAAHLRANKLDAAMDSVKIAFDIALQTAKFSDYENRALWIKRAEDAYEVAVAIEKKLKSGVTLKAEANTSDFSGQAALSSESEEVASSPHMMTRPTLKLDDISGMDEAKNVIKLRVIEPLRNPEKAKKHGLKTGGGILLYGLPGTGKTYFAKAVAGELGLPFFVIKSAEIMNKFVGETEKTIEAIFNEARQHPMSVIFIDEANDLLVTGSDVHPVTQRVTNYIQQEMDGIESSNKNPFLMIAATNYPSQIAPAILARLQTRIEVELPDYKTRQFILTREFRLPIDRDALDFLVDESEGYSCRDLVQLAEHLRGCGYNEDVDKYTLEFCRRNFKDHASVDMRIYAELEKYKKQIGVVKVSDSDKKKID